MKNKFLLILLLWVCSFSLKAQVYSEQDVQNEIRRIDLFDGSADNQITLSTQIQTQRASKVFYTIPNSIISYLTTENKGITYSRRVLKGLYDILSKVTENDYYHLTHYEKLMTLANGLVTDTNDEAVFNKLKAESKIAIYLSELIKNRTFAREYWLYTIRYYPTDALTQFITIYNEPYAMEVLEAIALDAPTVIKEYFGSNHLNYRMLKETKNTNVQTMLEIYKQFGSSTKAYVLINEIIAGRLTIAQANEIGKEEDRLFHKLLDIRKQQNIFGNYSVERELKAICMETVVEINLRHEETDEFRFAPINNSPAADIFAYLVYTPEEIFTSTFLGMYERMMNKREQKSGFQFLKTMNFNKFRVFLKECANYNKIDEFLSTLTVEEKQELFKMLCSDLDKTGGDLGPAVDVADFYGSLQRADLKKQLKLIVEKIMIERASNQDVNGMKLYGLLYKVMGGETETYIWQFNFVLPSLDRVTQAELFTNGKHIQEHFFFDDEDGEAAFNNFISGFGPEWKKIDKGSYLLITTRTTKVIEIYAIKPSQEIVAREELRKLFDKNRRYPDLIVHRGHSYYIENTIAALTNQTKVAILGSCGGYQNISQAMENAMDVQIVSTKQVGTLAVNNALIFETIETIRKGNDIVWNDLWKRVRAKVGGNPRFNDYIPPNQNLGARFIKAYNSISLNES